jgi:hypothetical protein
VKVLAVQGSGFRGQGFKVQGSAFRVQGSRFSVQGSRFKVQRSGFSPAAGPKTVGLIKKISEKANIE